MPVLGCIADDITGATDLAGALVRRGIATTQIFGVPEGPPDTDADAVVIALKTRTATSAEAREQSLRSCRWLRSHGVQGLYLKYCSTFDSTSEGNIGPVTDALLAELASSLTVHCPAYPANARTVYLGHLFVGRSLLSESGMANHPLTPMRDPDLLRVLGSQTPAAVGALPLDVTTHGPGPTAAHLADLGRAGTAHVIADAVRDEDIEHLAAAVAACELPLAAGGAPFGAAWGAALIRATGAGGAAPPVPPDGPSAVLVGSASQATLRQVESFARRWPLLRLPAEDVAAGPGSVDAALEWAAAHLGDGPVMVAADTRPEAVAAAQRTLGRERAASAVEEAMGRLAVGLTERGVRRLVVAGGETSGAVARALGVTRVRIGPEICTGVPWTVSERPGLALAFKSGNFGGDDFFLEAFARLDGAARGEPR
ncbi:four-carbon acid sugar kinase family protein [Streptomyces castrisilvae]|uniref:3-oxo-tetronate kinase n=1 Tax=Streptomyces castrisilvae TaxID=3033811 RepID=A0ABY9HKW2_9ACTN|nr:3-oxo-tetronate kinase [Streptomyces sp. Mut1]WLQ35190.1 four-carbon acid sugar kinase family protein [Streptomyces sp. Mut1]